MKTSHLTGYIRKSVNFRFSPFWDVAQHLHILTLVDKTKPSVTNYRPTPHNIPEGR
jgi:hypothetical protein